MKILQIHFKNLNSLVGEWHVDLEHPAYTSDGIFAITGPTGSGKTTLLDAMCLALYGRTPRLSKITKTSNEIMSRQTGECFAEVVFATPKGRFRCHWSQHRSRKKIGGELQAPKHEISNAITGEIFESKLRGVAEQIEVATGMDFDRFTRSMLLAQGSFAAFLQAAPDERSPILEQITGTEIYSQMSIRVHERQRSEREKLAQLQNATAGLNLLDAAQEQQLRVQLASLESAEAALQAEQASIAKAMQWRTNLAELSAEMVRLQKSTLDLQQAEHNFAPQLAQLQRANQAATLDGTWATLQALRNQQSHDQQNLEKLQAEFPQFEEAAQQSIAAFQQAEQHTLQCKAEQQKAAPQIQQARLLDQSLAKRKLDIDALQELCAKLSAALAENRKDRENLLTRQEAATHKRTQATTYLEAHLADQELAENLTGIEEQFKHLQTQQHTYKQLETKQQQTQTELQAATVKLEAAEKQLQVHRQEHQAAEQVLCKNQQEQKQLLGDRLRREYEAERETLQRERIYQARIAELEEQRRQLEDGIPCPLCGATDHPFAQGNIPTTTEAERKIAVLDRILQNLTAVETRIQQSKSLVDQALKSVHDAEKSRDDASFTQNTSNRILGESVEALATLSADIKGKIDTLGSLLAPWGIPTIHAEDLAEILQILQKKRQEWNHHNKLLSEAEKDIAEHARNLARIDATAESNAGHWQRQQAELENLNQTNAQELDARALLGIPHPDAEETRLQTVVEEADTRERQARESSQSLQQKVHTAHNTLVALREQIAQRQPQLETSNIRFNTALTAAGFSSEPQFIEARLSHAQCAQLTAQAGELEERKIALKVRQQDHLQRQASANALNLSPLSLEELQQQNREADTRQKTLQQSLAEHRHKLKENNAARERMADLRGAMDAQSKEHHRWNLLHELIGSADGKKFRNFAQGITFQLLIGHANQQLQKMSDRYLLLPDTQQALELNVMDNYQAGEVRTTKNLSGGESFLVSLALALGLSQMASKNVRVDSLFLDEGFGTLDDEALDTALETLGGLQQSGKLIGVISHVQALKERISTQIQITRLPGGRSTLSGPGCARTHAP